MADLPPPPAGFTLDSSSGAAPPPPPAGFKLDAPAAPKPVQAPASAGPNLAKWGTRMSGAELEPNPDKNPEVSQPDQQKAFEQRAACLRFAKDRHGVPPGVRWPAPIYGCLPESPAA